MRHARNSRLYLSTCVPNVKWEGRLHSLGIVSHSIRACDFLALQASRSSTLGKVTLLEDRYQ